MWDRMLLALDQYESGQSALNMTAQLAAPTPLPNALRRYPRFGHAVSHRHDASEFSPDNSK
jgi:hypothetical protein